MRNRFFNGLHTIIPCLVLMMAGWISNSHAQTKYLLPLGNSITQGKYNKQDPLPGEHGYRQFLYDKIHDDYSIDFVGTRGTAPYNGYFHAGSRIHQFLPDSTYDVQAMLDGLADKPDYVLLHLGTNDMGTDKNVGTHTTAGTILNDLQLLLNTLLDYNGGSIEQIFLCKIIPVAPFNEFPGRNAKILDFNSRIDLLYEDLTAARQQRVTLVNMHAPFYSNQFQLYNVDNDPSTDWDDHLHPRYPEGYQEMANVFADYLENYLSVPIRDDFNVSARSLHGYNNWVNDRTNDMFVFNAAPGTGGAVYSNYTADQGWNDLAVWTDSENRNSISIRIHPNSSANEDTIHRVGILVGLSSTELNPSDPSAANGYMVFTKRDELFLFTIENGILGSQVAKRSVAILQPGDSIQVTITRTAVQNRFDFSINGADQGSLTHNNPDAKFRAATFYSGIIFRGQSGNPELSEAAVFLDWFKAETKYEDLIPPGTITDLTVISEGNSTLTLQWTAVGDNGLEGLAANYDLRFSINTIGPSTFEDATIIPQVPRPGSYGTVERATVKGLLSGTTYYFAIKAVDRAGNKSNISNPASGVTEPVGQIIDDFDRSAMGPEWVCDTTEYKIDTVRDEMQNVLGSGQWGSAAIYKGRSNPTTVRVKLGNNYQEWTPGTIENFGMVVLAEDTSLTAGGYMIMIRKRYNVIYLYDIHWEGATRTFRLLDAISWDLPSYPVAGDEIAVVIDWSEEAYNRFDVYVNSRPASRFALYDPGSIGSNTSKLYGHVERNWAGLILARMNGIRNNNIASFITSGERASAAGIIPASATAFQDTVNRVLADSIKVRVLSTDNVPLEKAPVFFSIAEGNGSLTTPMPPAGRIYIEAEWWKDLKPPMIELNLPGESGNSYIVSTERTPSDASRGYAEYQFYIEEAGTYYFWARTKWEGSYTNNLLNFELRRGTTYLTPQYGFLWYIQRYEGSSTRWKWGKIRNVDTWFTPTLTEGMYTLRVYTHHADVPLDKILLTTESTGNLNVLLDANPEPTGALITNSQGETGTKLQLGKTAGMNRVRAWAFGTNPQVNYAEFTATGLPDRPKVLQKTNDNQTGNAGRTLPLPLTVTLADSFANPASGITVHFSVTGTVDGSVSPASATTNAAGQASTVLTLGYQDTVYHVIATVDGLADTAVFTANVNAGSGLIGELQAMPGAGAGQRHFVNQALPNFLKVKVLDDQDPPQPVVGTPISFEVVEGNATVGSPTYNTDSQGIATGSLTMASTPERVVVAAKTNLQQTIVVVDTAFYRGERMSWYSGGGYVLELGATAPAPCEVAVTNINGFAVQGQPVNFIIENGNGFHFTGGGTILNKVTDARGVASAGVVAGMVQGVYKGVVKAYSTDGFYPITGSPFSFDFHVKSQASSLMKISGDGLTGVVGNLVGPIGVRMVNRDGTQVIPNQPVHFTRTIGDGYFGGSLPKTSVVDTTDQNGMVYVYYRLGSESGQNNNGIVAWTKNGRDSLYTNFAFSAKSSDAYRMSPAGDTVLTGIVGKPLDQDISVVITDSLGNVKGEIVTFSVIAGGGSLNGTADTTETVVSDSLTGIASISWTLGEQAGVPNMLRAEAHNGLGHLKGSPLVFHAVSTHDSVSRSSNHSTISATGPIQATNRDTSHITITLRDKYHNPVPGKVVNVVVQGGEYDSWRRQTLPTDDSGQTVSFLYSRSAGEKTIKAIVDGDTLEQTARVICLAQSATNMMLHAGDGQIGNTGTVLKDPLVVLVTDGVNPVAYVPVTFSVTAGGGRIVGDQTVVTDAQGHASVEFILGSTVGTFNNEVEARSDGLSGSPVRFKASGRPGVPHTMAAVSEMSIIGKAGEVLPEPIVVAVKDIDGNAVAGVEMRFQVEGGGSLTSPAIVNTDEFGYARASYRADTQAGSISLVKAINNSLGSPLTFSISTIPGSPRKIVSVSGDLQEGFVGSTLMNSLVVRTTDLYGNSVGNQPVQFIIRSGDATIEGGYSVTKYSNTQGLASVLVDLGQESGVIVVEAVNITLEGSPVVFTLTAKPIGPVNLDIHSGDNQKGTVGHPLVDPLRVQITDSYDNPVPNYSVRFFKHSGGGQIIGSENVVTNANGIAMAEYRVGLSPGTDIVRAASIGKTKDFHVEAVYNSYFPVLNKTAYSKYNQKREKEYLALALIATDGNAGDELTFQAFEEGKLTAPRGARVLTEGQAHRTAIFEWTPDYDQQGIYSIVLRVIDNMGGFDADTVVVEVLNVNRKPRIVTQHPTVQDTTVLAGHTVIFWVDARDDDEDDLMYSWKVDGQSAGGNYAVYHHKVDRSFPGTQNVEVTVSDGVSSVKQSWNLDVQVSVQLSQFQGRFETGQAGILLKWMTSQENQNQGFHVDRSHSEDGPYTRISETLIPSRDDGVYSYLDSDVRPGSVYFYKLVSLDLQDRETSHGPIMVQVPQPDTYMLGQNYPNPFNPETVIRYQIPVQESVNLTVYNMMGQAIATLVDEVQSPGYYVVVWDGRDDRHQPISTGIYIYRLKTSKQVLTRRMIFLK